MSGNFLKAHIMREYANYDPCIYYMIYEIGYIPKDPFKSCGLLTGEERNGGRLVGFEEDTCTFLYL